MQICKRSLPIVEEEAENRDIKLSELQLVMLSNLIFAWLEVESHGCFFFLFYFRKTLADKL
jgi:hypothetical protein